MTLCAVWRRNRQIQIATDSRLSWGGARADVGVKLMPLVLRLYHATSEGEERPQIAHSRILGVATVGSLATTYVAKELLEAVLSNLQFAEGLTDISMAGIAEVCARVVRSVSKEICAAIFEQGQGQLVLVGHCLATEMPRVFLLTVAAGGISVDVVVEEILTENGERFFGSGAFAAKRHRDSGTDVFPYEVVRAVARDPSESSVGGNVQFGVLDGPDFRLMGIRDVETNEDLKEMYVGFYIGGLEIYGGASLFGDSGFAFTRSFLSPFEREIIDLMDRGYTLVETRAHW